LNSRQIRAFTEFPGQSEAEALIIAQSFDYSDELREHCASW